MSEWDEWVHVTTAGATSRQVGQRIGHSHTTALAWMREPTPQHAIGLALAYNADILGALVAVGLLTHEEAERLNLDKALAKLSSIKLTGELYRRAVAQARRHAEELDVFDEQRH